MKNEAESSIPFLSARLASVAEVMGMLPVSAEAGVNNETLQEILVVFARAGISRHAASTDWSNPNQLARILTEVLEAVEESPLPQQQWAPISELLGDELLGSLVGASGSSIHRYRSGERPTPDRIAARLHFVTLIIADLSGSYNDFGIRRWFGRSRSALDGVSPAEVLSGSWDPQEPKPERVRALSSSLLFPLSA